MGVNAELSGRNDILAEGKKSLAMHNSLLVAECSATEH